MTGLPLWQQIAGVLAATALVLAWALLIRRARQTPGRHRPSAVAPAAPAAPAVSASTRSPSVDDWTADLPTVEIPRVDPLVAEGVRLYLAYRAERDEWRRRGLGSVTVQRPRLSIANRLRDTCTTDTPIFAALARELGFEQMLVAA